MQEKIVSLSVPAEADFARAVRMMASNLAVVCGMNVDEVEDVRMAAEEGFVYSCATGPGNCDVAFSLADDRIEMLFSLGSPGGDPSEAGEGLDLTELLLSAVCDEHGITDEGKLLLVKRMGATDAE